MTPAADDQNKENDWINARIDPDLKRFAEMRASELGMNTSEYLLSLIREDLADVDYADL